MALKGELDFAYQELMRLMSLGWEFPDATAKICLRFRVNSEDLQRLYDEQMPSESPDYDPWQRPRKD